MASNTLELEYVTLDVFTQTRYAGNPLAVVHVPKTASLSQEQKQAIAREFNFSETTFVHEDGAAQWTVDIFTPWTELPFAGHPTIGTACHVLSKIAQDDGSTETKINGTFNLKAGPVDLSYDPTSKTAKAAIPHDVHIHKKRWGQGDVLEVQPRLKSAVNKNDVAMKEQFAIVSIVKGMTFILIELESQEALNLVETSGRSISVEGLDEGWNDTFVGTYFFVRTGKTAEGVTLLQTRMIEGTLEDPATGSAASDLACYLSLVEGKPGQALRYAIIQGVEMGRKSEINIEVVLAESGGIASVHLEGGAIQVMQGRLTI